jgi:hypothetical protein
MSQLKDLLVWVVMVSVLVAVVYFTPQIARYVSSENHSRPATEFDHSLALNLADPVDADE